MPRDHSPRIGHWDTRCPKERRGHIEVGEGGNEQGRETRERLAVTWRPGNRYDDVDLAGGPMRRSAPAALTITVPSTDKKGASNSRSFLCSRPRSLLLLLLSPCLSLVLVYFPAEFIFPLACRPFRFGRLSGPPLPPFLPRSLFSLQGIPEVPSLILATNSPRQI